jgi:hypothetical protein
VDKLELRNARLKGWFDAKAVCNGARRTLNQYRYSVYGAIISMAASFPGAFSHAQSLEIDTSSLIDSINQWVPVFFPIFAIGFGIAIAIAIVRMVGNSILQAFKGGGNK